MSPLQRAVFQAMGEDRTFGSEDDPAREKYPNLWEFLSTVYVGRDKLKQPARLTISLGPGGVLVQLVDPDLRQSLGMACAHLDEVLAQLEAAVSDPKAAWRPWGKGEPQLRKRRSTS